MQESFDRLMFDIYYFTIDKSNSGSFVVMKSTPFLRNSSIGTTPSAPVRVDPRGQEGWKLLGLLHEAGAATVERRYARGEVIFGEGDPGNALYVLTEGVVKLSRSYSEGKEATLMLFGPWEVFGELAFGRRAYQHARTEALTACRLPGFSSTIRKRA